MLVYLCDHTTPNCASLWWRHKRFHLKNDNHRHEKESNTPRKGFVFVANLWWLSPGYQRSGLEKIAFSVPETLGMMGVQLRAPLNPSIRWYCDVRWASGVPSIRMPWCRETFVSRKADRCCFFVWPKIRPLLSTLKKKFPAENTGWNSSLLSSYCIIPAKVFWREWLSSLSSPRNHQRSNLRGYQQPACTGRHKKIYKISPLRGDSRIAHKYFSYRMVGCIEYKTRPAHLQFLLPSGSAVNYATVSAYRHQGGQHGSVHYYNI